MDMYIQSAVFTIMYLGFVVLLNLSLNWRASDYYKASEAIAKGNSALGYRRSGAQIGLAIAMLGVYLGKSNPNFMLDLLLTVSYGFLAIIFIWISLMVIDKAILPNINNNEEVGNDNVAVGIVEFGTLVMTGILAFASIYGDTGSWLSSIIYFIIGQVTVIALVLIYEKMSTVIILNNIANGNKASGIYLSAKIIAYGLIMMSVIIGNTNDLSIFQALIEFVIAASVGMLFLYIAEILIDKLVLTKITVKEALETDNVAAILQLTGAKIGMAIILGFAIL